MTVPSRTSGYSLISEQDQSQKEQELIPGRPANQPDESVLGLNITQLLSFFQQHQTSCPPLQMICPWVGLPLPSIFVKLEVSLGWTATLELSKELSVALMKYIRGSPTTAKVSHWRGAIKHAALARLEDNDNVSGPLFRPCYYIIERTAGDSARATIFPDKDSADCRVYALKVCPSRLLRV